MFPSFKKNFFPKYTPGFLLNKTDTVCRGSDKMRRVETLSEGPGPPLTTTAAAQAAQAQTERDTTRQAQHNKQKNNK